MHLVVQIIRRQRRIRRLQSLSQYTRQAVVSKNLTNAQADWFVDWQVANLRLAAPVETVMGDGQYVEGLTLDIDGRVRPVDAVDIGASQY